MPSDPFVATLEEWIKVSRHRLMRNFIDYARKSGLSMSHIGALFHLYHEGTCGVTELGNHLDVTSAAASQMLERLVQQGLILRTEDPDDRRVRQIVLTDKGNRVLEEGIRAQKMWLGDLTETLSAAEKEDITVGLKILIEKVRTLKQPVEFAN
ncbi:MAG: MarR family transcriptional regulator [Anaerolineales bacterium]